MMQTSDPSKLLVLYHLTQLTATITPRSTPLSVQVKQKSDSGRKRTKDILCKSSFLEAVRSVSELAIDKLNVQNLAIPLRFNNHDVWEILEQLSKKNKFKIVEKCSKWNMSYISGLNFTENKRDFSFPQLSNRIINLSPICVYIPYHQNGTQVRCFKTDRNIKAEYDRNPTFSTRIRKWFGLIIQSDNKLKRISNQEANTITVNEHNIEKLRKNQDDRYMKAFAEGFVAGQEQKPQGRAFRLLRLAQQAVFTVLLVLLLAALVGAYRC